MPRVFLSYSSADKSMAQQIKNDLEEAGIAVWFDKWEIRVGDSIVQKIQQGLRESDFVVVLLTESSVKSGWVEKEWQSKIGQEAQTKGVVVLPIKADHCSIPELLSDKRYADIQSDYQEGLRDLTAAIKEHFAERIKRKLPSDISKIPLMRSLMESFGVDHETLKEILKMLPPPENFLRIMRHHLSESDADTFEILFYNHYDGIEDLWKAEQVVKLKRDS